MGFTGTDTIDGGAGSNTLTVNATNTDLNNASDEQFKNIQNIALNGDQNINLDLSKQSEGFNITSGNYYNYNADTITGSQGADSITLNSNDTVIGFVGADTISGSNYYGNNTLILNGTSIDLNNASDAQLSGVQIIDASSAVSPTLIDLSKQTEDLNITGSAIAANTIIGGSGNDTITITNSLLGA